MVKKASTFMTGFVVGFLLAATIWLTGWHKGFDVGYGAAMSDAFLNLKSPEQFFKDMLEPKDARRGVSN